MQKNSRAKENTKQPDLSIFHTQWRGRVYPRDPSMMLINVCVHILVHEEVVNGMLLI